MNQAWSSMKSLEPVGLCEGTNNESPSDGRRRIEEAFGWRKTNGGM